MAEKKTKKGFDFNRRKLTKEEVEMSIKEIQQYWQSSRHFKASSEVKPLR